MNHLKACEIDHVEWEKKSDKTKERKSLENVSREWQPFYIRQQTNEIISHIIIYMQKFQHAHWLRTRQLIPNSAES